MNITKHCHKRMSQRAISKNLIDFTINYGELKGDKIVTNKKILKSNIIEIDIKIKSLKKMIKKFKHLLVSKLIKKALISLQETRKVALKVLDKGGITIVLDGDSLITTYNTNSFRRF